LQKVAPGMPSDASHVLQPLLGTLSSAMTAQAIQPGERLLAVVTVAGGARSACPRHLVRYPSQLIFYERPGYVESRVILSDPHLPRGRIPKRPYHVCAVPLRREELIVARFTILILSVLERHVRGMVEHHGAGRSYGLIRYGSTAENTREPDQSNAQYADDQDHQDNTPCRGLNTPVRRRVSQVEEVLAYCPKSALFFRLTCQYSSRQSCRFGLESPYRTVPTYVVVHCLFLTSGFP